MNSGFVRNQDDVKESVSIVRPLLIRTSESLSSDPEIRLPRKFLSEALDVALQSLCRWKAMNWHLLKRNAYAKHCDPLVVTFVSDQEMAGLCKRYYPQKKITDVLSFPAFEVQASGDSRPNRSSLGEIVICLPYALQSSKNSKWSFRKELFLLSAHGVLHLMGYQHEGSARVRPEEMFEIQDKLLEKIC